MPNGSTLISALQPVRPGDLIEADFFNKIIDAVKDLDQRTATPAQPTEDGERHKFVIDDLEFARSENSIAFRVRGSGLKPSGLKGFYFNGTQFEAVAKGNDGAIGIKAEMRAVVARLPFGEEELAAGRLMVLTLENEAGETASGAIKVR